MLFKASSRRHPSENHRHGENEVCLPQSMAICRMRSGVPIFLRQAYPFGGVPWRIWPGTTWRSVDVSDWPYTCVILFSYIQSTCGFKYLALHNLHDCNCRLKNADFDMIRNVSRFNVTQYDCLHLRLPALFPKGPKGPGLPGKHAHQKPTRSWWYPENNII